MDPVGIFTFASTTIDGHTNNDVPARSGLSLWFAYIVWLVVVGVMYPLCRWCGDLKAAAWGARRGPVTCELTIANW